MADSGEIVRRIGRDKKNTAGDPAGKEEAFMLHEIAPKQYRVEYRKEKAKEGDPVILLSDNELYLGTGESLLFPTVGEIGRENYTYLFAIDNTRYFTVLDEEAVLRIRRRLEDSPETSAGYHAVPERSVRFSWPRDAAYAASVGTQLIGWYRRSVFCGRCGERTVHSETERMMYCPHCGNMIYPEIHPSVIVAIFHGEKLLVTRYSPAHKEVSNGHLFNAPVHEALVAGYIETGETAEEAVKREVMEEVGLEVKNIRFYKDTPWPFSGSLLFAFLCEVDGDPTIRIEESELASAVFKSREEMEDRSRDVSLTSAIMEDFRLGRL